MGSSSTDVSIMASAVVGVLANVAAMVVIAAWHGLLWAGLLIAATLFAALLLIWVKVRRRERLLARFIDACAFDDVSQVFGPAEANNDPRSLGAALNRAMQRLAKERTALATDSRLNAAFVDSTPVPVVTVSHTGTVHLINRSARQLFRGKSKQNVRSLATHGQAFVDALLVQAPGSRKEISIVLDDVPQKALLTVSRLRVGAEDLRIVAIQPIQGELDETEVATQRDLVRVLTHEIMNSITPVTSLARTSASLLMRMDQTEPEVTKATRAIMTLADRAEGIMAFVESYRQISKPMTVNRREFAAVDWVGDVDRLFRANPDHAEIAIKTRIEPNHFRLNADANLLTQLALNLLRNSAEAAGQSGRVTLSVERTAHGRARITVEDDGPGIAPDKRRDVFLPFFTTKANGSGVGLSLARQIALAHGGTITTSNSPLGGAAISVLL